MEATTLSKKKTTISKGKVKKTIKNVLCRADPIFWPNVSEEQASTLKAEILKYKVDIPEFQKPHWKELKAIPKDQRPKSPKIKRVEGLLFGLTECTTAVQSKHCSAVIIESSVNPQTVVQPLIEACISAKLPVLCLNGLRKTTATNFGVPTSCLGIKNNFLEDLRSKVIDIAKSYSPPQPIVNKESKSEEVKVDKSPVKEISNTQAISCPYLYRTIKKTRVFNPSIEEPKMKKAFIGQDFIKFSDKQEVKTPDSKAYMNMILKRVTNNQNRAKRK